MYEIRTEITLAAPADRIWELLTDCNLYTEWNPLFTRAIGRFNAGEKLELLVNLPRIEPFTINPQVHSVEPQERLCWQYRWVFATLFSWKYCAELEILAPDRLRFIQRSAFAGILGPLFKLALATSVRDGLAEMNKAIKRWGEKGNVRCLKC